MLLPEADWVVTPEWAKDCYGPDFGSEALLHAARFHAAPAVRRQ